MRSAAEPGLVVLLNPCNNSGITRSSAGASVNVRLLLDARTAEPPAEAPAASAGEAKVSLLYDAVLNCYFDPVTHRYFELC